MNDMYRDHLLDHYENPRQQGSLEAPSGTHEDCNPLCGDCLRIDVRVSEDGKTLADAVFSGQGCIVSQAAASMLLEDAVGKDVDVVRNLSPEYLLELVGAPLTPARVKCALLSLKVLKSALH
jgi:nitrogen fixation protein NifU and related proteins